MPAVDEQGKPVRLDEDGAPLDADDKTTKAFYSFALWDNVLINGEAWSAGLQPLLVPESADRKALCRPWAASCRGWPTHRS